MSFRQTVLVTHKQTTPYPIYKRFIYSWIPHITSVQLREKNISDKELIEFGHQLHEWLEPYGIPLIVNDRLDICRILNAEGLHLGQQDGSVMEARQELGEDKIIGLSINTEEQLLSANECLIDYVGIGPIFPSTNKSDKPVWGIEALRKAQKISRHPIIAIGGIHLHNMPLIFSTGVAGIAAISLFKEATPYSYTNALEKISTAIKES